MTTRLEILQNSLANKKELFSSRLDNLFSTVREANGQPLNDKPQAIIAAIDSVEREMDRADYSNQNRVDYQTRMQNIALSALHHINSTRLELA